ncbi:MAG TPA: DUF1156 domain-containing protein [Blastocatellia bacterium]
MTPRKKLIEVALPLEAINVASAREKSIRHGHPSTMHLWWSRKPLASCRAVLFAQIVDDPSSRPDKFPTDEAQEAERERLFEIIRDLVKWENSNNEHVLASARTEILRATDGHPPPVLDPFCGGGSIPLEAQRLGLEAHGSDLNPVAVLITKALIEIPPKFAGRPPVHPVKDSKLLHHEWRGPKGLAEDVHYYGQWMRKEAERRIGHLYPKVKLPDEHGGGEATVIAWLYCRAVKCPNPACGAMMPLASKFWISTKKGKQAWIKPALDHKTKSIHFEVETGTPDSTLTQLLTMGSSYVNDKGKKVKATFKCIICGDGIAKGEYINLEANAGRIESMPLAIVAEGKRGRVCLPFYDDHIEVAFKQSRVFLSNPSIDEYLPKEPSRGTFASNAQGRIYGFKEFADYYSARQLVTLATFCKLVGETREQIMRDILENNVLIQERFDGEAINAEAYADAIATYLGIVVSKASVFLNLLSRWRPGEIKSAPAFGRQGIPMVWDFAEVNPFAGAGGDFDGIVEGTVKVLLAMPAAPAGEAKQLDATSTISKTPHSMLICTDPPYYDNISYADLSDFFYVWLRRTLLPIYPNIFGTLLTPKSPELVATPYRFDSNDEKARQFFEKGLENSFKLMIEAQHGDYPLTVFYAFKQSESDDNEDEGEADIGVASTGWETMLEGLLKAGFSITGTWPIRTEGATRLTAMGTNVLASSIALVCRPRPDSIQSATRREFINALKRELPDALKKLQHGNIAPVDLAQASIGPGMAIYSRYAKVLEADGQPMSVRTALQTINQELDAYLSALEGGMDRDTQFCLAWFEQYGMNEGPFGDADLLARARNTAVDGLVKAGVLYSKAGKVRLLKRAEYPEKWNPSVDVRLSVWECTQHLIRRLHSDTGGEEAAARLVNELGGGSEDARALAYRLYSICERKKWADEALAYNTLVVEWPAIQDKAAQLKVMPTTQAGLFS